LYCLSPIIDYYYCKYYYCYYYNQHSRVMHTQSGSKRAPGHPYDKRKKKTKTGRRLYDHRKVTEEKERERVSERERENERRKKEERENKEESDRV
jgi:hypothetical protein